MNANGVFTFCRALDSTIFNFTFFEDAEELKEVFAGEMERNTYSRFSNPDINELVDQICTFKVTDDGLIRLSIGLENIEDIKQDIDIKMDP